MATRPSLTLLNATQLGEMLHMKPGTVRNRLAKAGVKPCQESGNERRFDSLEALGALLAGERLDYTAERARLAKEQADAQELKNAELRGELLPRADHEEVVISLASAVALRLDALPSKAGPEVRATGSDAEAEAVLRTFLDEAAVELADLGAHLAKPEPGVAPGGARGPGGGARGVPAPAAADGQRVGRPRKKAQSRKQR